MFSGKPRRLGRCSSRGRAFGSGVESPVPSGRIFCEGWGGHAGCRRRLSGCLGVLVAPTAGCLSGPVCRHHRCSAARRRRRRLLPSGVG